MLIDTTYLDKINPDSPLDLAEGIARLLDDRKGIDVTVIDLMGKTIVADYFVIASATSTTGVKALSDHVMDELEKRGIKLTGELYTVNGVLDAVLNYIGGNKK